MKKHILIIVLLLGLLLSGCSAPGDAGQPPAPTAAAQSPAVEATPAVEIIEPTPLPTPEPLPLLSLQGDEQLYWDCGIPFSDPGYIINFDTDTPPEHSVEVTGEVTAWLPGDYTVDYVLYADGEELARCQRLVSVRPVSPERTEPTEEKVIYLTFDDGPCKYTPQVLEILDKYDAKATFFVITSSKYCEEMLPAIQAAGHTIGIHGNSHTYNTLYWNEENFFTDFMAAQEIIYQYTGEYAKVSRFPGGSYSAYSLLRSRFKNVAHGLENMGVRYFDWNVQAEASETLSTDQTFKTFCYYVPQEETPISLQHDTRIYSVNALEDMLAWGTENGYSFKAIDSSTPDCHSELPNSGQ